MEAYKNLSGNSDVLAYEIGMDSITVQFRDDSIYLYTYRSAGEAKIEKMKQLAHAGQGLNTFINQVVKQGYADKIR